MRLTFPILLTCLLLSAQAFAVAADKPNILVILPDDLGYLNGKAMGEKMAEILGR